MKKEKWAGAVVIGTLGVLANPAWSHDLNKHANTGENSPVISPRAEQSQSGEDMNLSSQDIREAQQRLSARGFQPGNVDGIMDNQTREAITDFQQSNSLPVTGTLDENTAALLGVEANSPLSESTGAVPNPPSMDEDYGMGGRVEHPADSYSQ